MQCGFSRGSVAFVPARGPEAEKQVSVKIFAQVSPVGRALTRGGLVVVNAPFGDECGNFFGRSKRFRAEDHLPVPLKSAIQTFLCGGSRLPFGRTITKHVSCFRLVVVCVECVHLVRSPPSWCDTASRASHAYFVLCSCHFRFKAWFVGCTARRADHGTHVWTGQGHVFDDTPVQAPGPSWIKLKPEDLSEQICKLAKKGMTPSSIGVTLRDSSGVPQVKMITDNKILRILRKESLAPSIPEDLYFLVKMAVSVRKHLDKSRKDRDSKFRLILVESRFTALRGTTERVKSLPANWNYVSATTSALRGMMELVTPLSVMNVVISLGDPNVFVPEDHLPVPLESAIQTFLCGGSRLPFGSGQFPFGKPLTAASRTVSQPHGLVAMTSASFLFKERRYLRVRVLYIYLSGGYQEFPFGNEGQFAFVNPIRRN